MQDTKYVFLSALISAVLGCIIKDFVYRVDVPAFHFFRFYLGVPIIAIVAVVVSTYIGTWRIGRIRNPSFAFACMQRISLKCRTLKPESEPYHHKCRKRKMPDELFEKKQL
jgi:quinol-cytochrome oxidoreductase complex cytochrome b subunit